MWFLSFSFWLTSLSMIISVYPCCCKCRYFIHFMVESYSIVWRRQWYPTPLLLPGKSHGRRSPVGSSPVRGVTKSRTRLSDFNFTFHFHALEKEMATHSSVLAWRIPGTGEPGGLLSMGSHRVGHDWSDSAAAAAAVLHCICILQLLYPFFCYWTSRLLPCLGYCE